MNDTIQAKVDQLAKGFLARLPARLDAIDVAFALCRTAPDDTASWLELHRLLHSLGGAAGTFGVAALGSEARRIEGLIADWRDQARPGAAQVDELGVALAGLRTLAAG